MAFEAWIKGSGQAKAQVGQRCMVWNQGKSGMTFIGAKEGIIKVRSFSGKVQTKNDGIRKSSRV